jgi:hypothetical protein
VLIDYKRVIGLSKIETRATNKGRDQEDYKKRKALNLKIYSVKFQLIFQNQKKRHNYQDFRLEIKKRIPINLN